jgi:hypothetical protein
VLYLAQATSYLFDCSAGHVFTRAWFSTPALSTQERYSKIWEQKIKQGIGKRRASDLTRPGLFEYASDLKLSTAHKV